MPSPTDNPALSDFARLAETFCNFIETEVESRSHDDALHDLHVLLAPLYLGALLLPDAFSLLGDKEARSDPPIARPPERYAAVMMRISPMFGERNYYREVFDPYAPDTEGEGVGSIADDIADIYGHIRDGLDFWSAGALGNALFEWRFNFEIHWAEHASGALRALFARSAWYDLGWSRKAE